VQWSAADRVHVSLCRYGVQASDTRAVRVTVYAGGWRELARSLDAAARADGPGGVDEEQQWADVALAELWQLLPPGQLQARCLVEVRLRSGPKAESRRVPGTLHLDVSVVRDERQ
jgi:hypothetical protein